MEIIMISDSKIKVMLSADDLKGFDLDTASLDYSNTETKRMFWDILSRAKRSVGFDTDGHRVLVQLYPSRCGGCEMFVTRLSCLSCTEKGEQNERAEIEPVINQLPPQKSFKKEHKEGRVGAFAFESIGNLINVCRRLVNMGYDGESDAYVGDDKRSYLFLSDIEPCAYLPLDEFSFISEYGTEENEEATRSYVSEHAKEICKNRAVEELARF
jgi:negative regulator of genetic competence, sporulation and motility